MTDPLQLVVSEVRRLRRDTERQRIRSHERTVWLTTARTHTDWDGDAKNVGDYDLDLSAAQWLLPAGVRAVHVRAIGKWTAANDTYALSLRPGGGGSVSLGVRALVANIQSDNSGWVPCNAAGDIRATVSGANAASVYVAITGYML